MSIELQKTSAGAILYDPRRAGKPTEEIFVASFWEGRRKVVARAQGRGGALFIRDDERYWVLRHYRRGGLIAKVSGDSYLWLGAERTRAFREWRLLNELSERGLPVPAPVAARFVKSGLIYRADLITEALPATRTLADSVTGVELREDQWRKIGATIASFHGAGVHHADLNAHNILLGAGGEVFVIDFDRGRVRARGSWERRVLARLHRSLVKISGQRDDVRFNERDWAALMRGIGG